MQALDGIILAAFALYALFAGLRSRRVASRSLEEYFLAGRSLSGWKAGLSMAATQFAADTPLVAGLGDQLFLWGNRIVLDAPRLARDMAGLGHPGAAFRPHWFRPGFQKWQGRTCAGVQVHITDPRALRSFAVYVDLLARLEEHAEVVSQADLILEERPGHARALLYRGQARMALGSR